MLMSLSCLRLLQFCLVKLDEFLFMYLGFSIGGDARCLNFWEPVIDRLKSRLFDWKSINLLFGGRLILLKSVLSSLLVYTLSFFRAPSVIISSIESILIHFFWGRGDNHRKISWVNWNSICVSKEVGVLRVQRLKEFNIALLCKWCWRYLMDRNGLCFFCLLAMGWREGGSWME